MKDKIFTDMQARHLMTTIAKACPHLDHRLITMQGSHQLMQFIATLPRPHSHTQAYITLHGVAGTRYRQSLSQLADTLKAISPPRHDMTTIATITRSFQECVKLMNDKSE